MRKLKNNELNRKSIQEFKSADKIKIIVILDNIRSLNNIGSVFRTGDAFLIDEIYLCGITACPPHKDIHKTALGATDTVDWRYFKDTKDAVEEARKKGCKICAIEQVEDSSDLSEFNPINNQGYALVFGHEVKGVQQEIVSLCDTSIEIHQYGTKHSLNISVSAGIVIWEFFKKMTK